MRYLYGFALLFVVLWGCGKSESAPAPVFTTPDGIWMYTTPDNAIHVEFELKTSTAGVLEIIDSSIEVSGTKGTSAAQLTNVDLPMIEEIRINANDIALTYPYSITFSICTTGSAFNTIAVEDVSYTYPWGQVETLSGITITRK